MMPPTSPSPRPVRSPLAPDDTFVRRHVGPDEAEIQAMLASLGLDSLDALVERTIPASIRMEGSLPAFSQGEPRGEDEMLAGFARSAARNEVFRSYIGMGYHGCIVPPVIQRNILENPGWYTQYTPYQAEISQGRLEALLNFQTAVSDLCGLPLANSSLLDEATAAAEAMTMCHRIARGRRNGFFAAADCHPQVLAVVQTRAEALGLEVTVGDPTTLEPGDALCGVLLAYPGTTGEVADLEALAARVHDAGALVVAATDLLALTLLRAPGAWGADIAIGSAQRFGVPMGYGGPHAAFLATREEHKRQVPGRLIGVSRDAHGNRALRMAMQTREQHIRRDTATSNICTAQVLLAIMAGMYAVYHGPEGLTAIATRVRTATGALAAGLAELGYGLDAHVAAGAFFDTLRVPTGARGAVEVHAAARALGINLREIDASTVGVALDETVTAEDLADLLEVFGGDAGRALDVDALCARVPALPAPHARTSEILSHPVFHRYHPEHEMLRYLHRLEARDLSLTTSMIPLGSCTMKLNATSEMLPVTWPEFGALHPFAPRDQAQGYAELFANLESALCEITGFDAISLQPNAGSQGEYAGLLAIRGYHRARGDAHRTVCLIPVSAHGTNPASAVLAGMRVVAVACDEAGNIDVDDLRARASEHADNLAALMVTYPSTHGVFEEAIREICDVVHEHGGQVYMDGANMNAQVGLCRPADFGADVCHLNLHKTFCIPHGGGGPGMGPIGVKEHLAAFLPGHPVVPLEGADSVGPVSAAPWGSPSILTISWVYIALMGSAGLEHATKVAILNANYMAKRLGEHYDVLYTGAQGSVAHEFILDFRGFDDGPDTPGITVEDVAKRLMDYGFHAPTMSFPVAGTLMIEPTESETRAELDRLCDALILIRGEIRDVAEGRLDRADNPLKNAPHTCAEVVADSWSHPYSRERAAYPAPWVRAHKFWPAVGRVDNGFGDRNLLCTCPPMEAYAEPSEAAAADGVPVGSA